MSQTGAVTCPIPPSPGTRRRHFSFQPISPRACQPGSGQSPPASPFISPRSTPVHMLRSRHSSGSALPLHLLPGNNIEKNRKEAVNCVNCMMSPQGFNWLYNSF